MSDRDSTRRLDRAEAGVPTVSVVIAVRDGERYLAETIRSILDQTHPVAEIIVVDDGSTDDSATIAEGFGEPVRVIRTEPRSTAAARNVGLAACTGDLIALCDADDLFLPDKTERQLALIDDLSAPVAVFCGMSEFVSPDLDPSTIPGRAPNEFVAEARVASGPLATRAAVSATGPFDPAHTVGDWVGWCIKLSDAAEIRFAEGALVRRRIHDRNNSLRTDTRSREWAMSLHAHLRRRQPG